MQNPLITLTTDFGTADHFAGVMKGVILSIAPNTHIVDITHEIRAFDVTEGAFVIAQAYRYFPKDTVHAVVVDPGVGSTRRPVLAEMAGQYFVAPDNGVLSMIFSREEHKVRHIASAKYFMHRVSPTFHGRDIFAPVAAHLATGVPPSRFGKAIRDYLRLGFENTQQTGKRSWTGAVLRADRFGNLITSFHIDEFPSITRRPFELNLGLEKLTRLATTFAEGNPGEIFVVVGSSGYLEVVANQVSAAKMLGCGAGSPAELTLL